MATRVNEGNKPCIWMEAGVIDFKICNKNFDCENCELDQAMTAAATDNLARRKAAKQARGKQVNPPSWEAKMHQRFGGQRKCQLMTTSLCHQCSFDELLEEQFDFFLAPESPKVQEVFGISVPTFNFLHRGHTWVALENAGRVRIGLDDFCQKVLGPVDKIKLPEPRLPPLGAQVLPAQAVFTLIFRGLARSTLAGTRRSTPSPKLPPRMFLNFDKKKVSLPVISKLLRHQNLQTTERYLQAIDPGSGTSWGCWRAMFYLSWTRHSPAAQNTNLLTTYSPMRSPLMRV
jgi:hypothetical protein